MASSRNVSAAFLHADSSVLGRDAAGVGVGEGVGAGAFWASAALETTTDATPAHAIAIGGGKELRKTVENMRILSIPWRISKRQAFYKA